MSMKRIMVVDDEKEIRELFHDVLESRGYEVVVCDSGKAAIEAVKEQKIFAAFIDIRMPGIDGVQTLKEIKSIQPEMQVVMITGYTRNEAVEEALRLGCFVCMMKPFKLRDILGVLEVIEAGLDDNLPLAA
ncbi:MAG TPA: response regulator [Armatimonadota bacterium]|nr:response regulator [Armatimonadota bacterium]